jgi:hypothetical protein
MTHEQGNTQTPWCVQNQDEIWDGEAEFPGIPLFKPANQYRSWGREYTHAERAANAQLIVTAVNERATLLSQVRQKDEALRKIRDMKFNDCGIADVAERVFEMRQTARDALSPAPQPGADAEPLTRNEVDRLAADRPNSQFDSGDRGQAPQPDAAPADEKKRSDITDKPHLKTILCVLCAAKEGQSWSAPMLKDLDIAIECAQYLMAQPASPLPADDVVERALKEWIKRVLNYPSDQPCKHWVLTALLSEIEGLGAVHSGSFIKAVVDADDETALSLLDNETILPANLLRQSPPADVTGMRETLEKKLTELHAGVYRLWEAQPDRHPTGMSSPPLGNINEICGLFSDLKTQLDNRDAAAKALVEDNR